VTVASRARRLVLLAVLPILAAAGVLAGVPVDSDAGPPLATPALAPAADTSLFRADNIVSDAVFFDSGAMSAAQIQNFLNAKGANCSDGEQRCLKDFRQITQTQPADAYCRQYTGAAYETAATIIAKVSQACDINPRVILVMLQKETSMVTRTAPSTHLYNRAMGFGCPDNNNGQCSAYYPGFFRQVFFAARQFQRYKAGDAGSYKAGLVNNIQYNPNVACGSSPVRIANQATANLYNYTPYQPNRSALAAGYGVGDSCGAYGNRNFWLYFTDWFGSTQTPGRDVDAPIGSLDHVGVAPSTITVSGWTFDPSAETSSINVHVYVDGRYMAPVLANGSRRDVGHAFPGVGSFHGYSGSVIALPGKRTVCVYAVNIGAGYTNPLLRCRTVTVPGFDPHLPVGGVDSASVVGSTVTIGGWAIDPDTPPSPVRVHVYVNGAAVAAVTADQARSDVYAVYPRATAAHGFGYSRTLPPGTHQICAYAINLGAGRGNPQVGCQTVVVGGSPFGGFEEVDADPGQVHITGWALDPDTTGSIQVQAKVGRTFTAPGLADQDRPEVETFRPGYGAAHGFDLTIPATEGEQAVCVYGLNTGAGANALLGCRSVEVPGSPPSGNFDTATPGAGSITAAGWAFDQDDLTVPVQVRVQVDGRTLVAVRTSTWRPDVGAAFPGVGNNRGWSAPMTGIASGNHQVCAYAVDTSGAMNPVLLGTCKTVTVP
jgi:hypothetical protein